MRRGDYKDEEAAEEPATVPAQLAEIKKYAKKIKKMEAKMKESQKEPAPPPPSSSSDSESESVASDSDSSSDLSSEDLFDSASDNSDGSV